MAGAPVADELDPALGLTAQADHRDAERVLREAGWTACGAGDWAIALRSPTGDYAARITPFDPATPYNAELYRRAGATGLVPELVAEVELDGGASLLVLELLQPVDERRAAQFHEALETGRADLSELAAYLRAVHERARRELPWCGPVDRNPTNVMQNRRGRLVLIDPFYADGRALYGTVLTDPGRVAAAIPRERRRHMFELPLANTGAADPDLLDRMRQAMAQADQERG